MPRGYHTRSPRGASRTGRGRPVAGREPRVPARDHAPRADTAMHRAAGRRTRYVALGARAAVDVARRRGAALDMAALARRAPHIARLPGPALHLTGQPAGRAVVA